MEGGGIRPVTRQATGIGAATLLSRVFGLARDTAFAVLFGTGFVADAFNLAFLLPNFFRRIVGEGNLNPAFVPVFTEVRERRGDRAGGVLLRRVAGSLFAVLLVLTLAGEFLAEPLVRLYARDWSADPAAFDYAVRLLRILFPYLLFAGGAALAGAALNSLRHFRIPALAPILLNLSFLSAAGVAVLRGGSLESRAVVFALGGLAGGLLAWFAHFPVMRRLGLPITPAWKPSDPDVRRIGALMLPGLLAFGVTQVNLLVDTLLALRLEEGSLSALRLGNRVTLLPMGVIGVAISTAALPDLSMRAARGDLAQLREGLAHSLRLLFALLLPAAAGLMILSEPIVRLLFQYGEFTAAHSTPMTAGAVAFYALGLPAFGLVKGLAQGYYSVQDTKTPVRIACVAMGTNIVLNFALVGPMGLRGLALATSLAACLNTGLLLAGLRGRIGLRGRGALTGSVVRTLAATLALGVGCVAGAALGAPVGRVGEVAGGVVGGLSLWLVAGRLLRHRELADVVAVFRRRAGRQ
ncbi:MAG: murein biosynthesis integral membrane protein MurJ [Gemmatimonadota bacterium]|jgi:putative peptidoglycan lipid II flippase|nr:murein biosynthesis integral membrane protein MurJ [Gemmatimonadota bacterium]